VTWLVLTIVFFILGLIGFLVGKLSDPGVTDGMDGATRAAPNPYHFGGYAFAGLMALAWVILTLTSAIHIIDAGHVGIIKTFGSIDGQVGDGPTFVAPWSDVIAVSTRVQKREFDHLGAFSKETQDVFVDATANIAVAPDDVQCLYRTVGSDWYEKLIPSRVLQTLKDETVKYTTVQVAPHREAIRAAVRARLQQQLSNFRARRGACAVKIDVQDFLLRNVDFRPEFKDAIEKKQIATQDAQTAQNRVAQKQAEADGQVATAKGDARSNVARAEGEATATLVKARAQANANRLLARSLTNQVIQYQYVTKLAPNVQAIVPNNGTVLIPSSALGK
jgi:regulator of protease activity HflC (stomatin/prohibitin superfamily)